MRTSGRQSRKVNRASRDEGRGTEAAKSLEAAESVTDSPPALSSALQLEAMYACRVSEIVIRVYYFGRGSFCSELKYLHQLKTG